MFQGLFLAAEHFREAEIYGFVALKKIYRLASTRKNVHFNFADKIFCERVKRLNFKGKNQPLS